MDILSFSFLNLVLRDYNDWLEVGTLLIDRISFRFYVSSIISQSLSLCSIPLIIHLYLTAPLAFLSNCIHASFDIFFKCCRSSTIWEFTWI